MIIRLKLNSLFSLQHIPMEELIKRNTTVAFTFLQDFQKFFMEIKKCKKDHLSHVKGGQNTLPGETSESKGVFICLIFIKG